MASRRPPQPRDRGFGERTAPLRSTSDPRPAPIGAVVRVLDAQAYPSSFVLRQGACVIGSAPTCDIAVSEATVSRTHVELGLVPEGVTVSDLGSRNGTFYQGQRVEKMVLAFGGRIRVGATTVAIDADTDSLVEGLEYDGTLYRGMVGASRAMRRVFAMLHRLEGSLATVLVEGESGVGKELVARALHEGSSVAAGPFVAVNCAAIPRDVVGSELFGHKRGAFTGAIDARKGAFETADKGTLFLDEIGELPPEIQPMLLRALELGEIRALGDDQPKRIQVRLIAATNRDLDAEVSAAKFRQDLFYRLAVVRLRVPPLRERPEDIEPLARRFAAVVGLSELPEQVIAELRARSWPGNAREVLNAVQAYAALGVLPEAVRARNAATSAGFRDAIDVRRPYADQKDEVIDRFTVAYLQELLAFTSGNQSEAARLSGINRGYLGRLLVRHGLRSAAQGADEGD